MSALPADRHKETTCRRDNATVVAHDEGEEGGRGRAATVSGEGIAQPRSDLFRTKTATRKWPRQIAEWNGPSERITVGRSAAAILDGGCVNGILRLRATSPDPLGAADESMILMDDLGRARAAGNC